MATSTINKRVLFRIYKNKRGWVFTPSDFIDLGSLSAVRKTLERLTIKGTIRRIERGFYDFPELHNDFGICSPGVDEFVMAFARQNKCRVIPWGGYAANVLGINPDVPAKCVYLTDRSCRKKILGRLDVIFRKTTPKNLAVTSEIGALVIQGLKFMRKRHVNFKVIQHLRWRLDKKQKDQILKDIPCAPAWIAKVIKKVVTVDWRAY